MTQNSQTQIQLKIIPCLALGFGLLSFLVAFIYFRQPSVLWGIVVGNALAVANFIFLTKMVVKMMDANYTRKTFLGVLFFLKLLFVLGVVVAAFGVFHVSVVGFAAGYAALVVAIFVGQVF